MAQIFLYNPLFNVFLYFSAKIKDIGNAESSSKSYSRVACFCLFAWGYVFHITFHTHTSDPWRVHFPLLKEVLLVCFLRGFTLSLGELDSCWFAKCVFLSKIGVSGRGFISTLTRWMRKKRGSSGALPEQSFCVFPLGVLALFTLLPLPDLW